MLIHLSSGFSFEGVESFDWTGVTTSRFDETVGPLQSLVQTKTDTENSARLSFRLLTGRPLAPPPELLRAVVDIGAATPLLFSGKKNGLAAVPT